ncbi:proteasome subunit beta type 2, putative [Cryptosporidium muris RN66]|uniref:Proteasome subunit beta n=1 Tax=Cryptosporidium muris (strain RN66) TaxID=441375 RepID=B6AFY3_CRYMR|nr:proteasome subunit beta type 2, putative [Cryptosporidium muris RN66]EEA07124.1 proteasome subunit beta type 2, putative [Cryptosporidium muris RN66]|eukprot:XP_002141473.1 proteasome subunit beta type 2 [Cryptosporidium muris RN66]
MDSLIGIKGPDFVIIAADSTSISGISRIKHDEDKILSIDGNKLIATAGDIGDRNQFGEFIKCNINLYSLRNNVNLGTSATASFTRLELAELLRSNPHNVRMLIGGYNDREGPLLYWIDEIASMASVNKAAHGYGGLLVTGILDRFYKSNLTQDEALNILIKCTAELKSRFLISQYDLFVKIVDKNGMKILKIENGVLVPLS